MGKLIKKQWGMCKAKHYARKEHRMFVRDNRNLLKDLLGYIGYTYDRYSPSDKLRIAEGWWFDTDIYSKKPYTITIGDKTWWYPKSTIVTRKEYFDAINEMEEKFLETFGKE